MKNNFQSKAVPRGTRTIWRYLGALFLLFTFAIGNVWAADITVTPPTPNNASNPFSTGLYVMSFSGTGSKLSSGAITTGTKGAVITINFQATKSDMYIKTITFNSLGNGTLSSDDGTFDGQVFTATGNKNSVNVVLTSGSGQKGTVKVTNVVVNTGTNVVETITFTGVDSGDGKKATFTSSAATSALSSITTDASAFSVSSGKLSWTNGKKVILTAESNIKYVAFSIADGKMYDSFSAAETTYNSANYSWSGSSKTVTLTNGSGGGREIKGLYVIIDPVVKHHVTYSLGGDYGTTPTQADVAEGAKFTLHNGTTDITAPAGKKFDGWHDGTTKYAGGAEYTMGGDDVELTALWADVYTVTYVPNNGILPAETMTDSNSPYMEDDEVTLLANAFTAPENKEFDAWVVTKTASGDPITVTAGKFTMPAEAVTVTATWKSACALAPTVSATTLGTTSYTTQVVNCAGISVLGSAGCTISEYGFVYGTATAPTISDNKKALEGEYTVAGTAFPATTLSGLAVNTKYYVRAYATNSFGTAYGDEVEFTTLAALGNVAFIAGNAGQTSDAITALRDNGFVVTVRTKASTPDYTGVDLVVLDESLSWGSNSDEAGTVISANVPILNLKAFFYTLSSRWNWGTPVNPSPKSELATLSTEYCNTSSHPIFEGVTITAGAVDMIGTSKDGNNLQGVTTNTLVDGKKGYTLATSATGTTCIHELTAAQRGVADAKYLLIALSSNIKDNLSDDAKKLIVNAAKYLIGSTAWAPEAPKTVTHTLTGVTTVSAEEVCAGVDYEATYVAESGYSLPASIVVKVNGAAIDGANYTWNQATGELAIPAAQVTNDIEIVVNGVFNCPAAGSGDVLFSWTPKSGSVSTEYIAAGGVDLAPYMESVVGGAITGYAQDIDGTQTTLYKNSNNHIYFNGNPAYIQVDLCELAEGDKFLVSGQANNLWVSTSATRPADAASAAAVLVPDEAFYIPNASALIGLSTIYIFREADFTEVASLTITRPEKFTVTYVASDLTAGDVPAAVDAFDGQKIIVAGQGTMVKGADNFAGWKDAGDNAYAAGDELTVTSDLTLTAQWVSCTPLTLAMSGYTTTLTAGGATTTVTLDKGASTGTVTWESSDATILSVEDGVITPLKGGTATVTAHVAEDGTYCANDITSDEITVNCVVTYDANGGEGTMADATGTTVTIAANGFTYDSHKFLRWNTQPDGLGDDVAVGATVNENKTLYAIWKTISCQAGTNIFSIEFTNDAVVKMSYNDPELNLAPYATIVGGNAYMKYFNGTNTDKDVITSDHKVTYGTNNQYLRLELDCALQAGDVISVANGTGQQIAIAVNLATGVAPKDGTKEVTVGYVYTVQAGDNLVGQDNLFLGRASSGGTTHGIVTIYRPLPDASVPTIDAATPADASYAATDPIAAMTVSADAVAPKDLHYQWYKENGETDIEVGTDAASYTPTASGEYYCVVTNSPTGYTPKSATSRAATITMISSDATLAWIKAGDVNIALSAGVYDYEYTLPYDYAAATAPVITVGTTDPNANAEITQAATKTGKATIHVVAQDNVTVKDYSVKFNEYSGCMDAFWFAEEADATANSLTNNSTFFSNMVGDGTGVSATFEVDGTEYTVTRGTSSSSSFGKLTIPAGFNANVYVALKTSGSNRTVTLVPTSGPSYTSANLASSGNHVAEFEDVAAGTYNINVSSGSNFVMVKAQICKFAMEGVSLPATESVLVGQTVTLTPVFDPTNASNKNVTWESNDEDVATVANGVVTGVAAGTAKITVTTEDGNFHATCTVTVSELDCDTYLGNLFALTIKDVDATSVSVSTTEIDMSTYATIENGTAFVARTEGSASHKIAYNQSSVIQFQYNTDKLYLKLNLQNCSLKEGDMITITGTEEDEFAFTTNTTRATTYKTTGHKYVVQYGDALVGASTIYVWRVSGNTYMKSISIDRVAPSYTRPVNPAYLGTLCWKNNAAIVGATLYEFAGKNENNYLVFDEVPENRLEAGKPYIFMPENGNTKIWLYNTDSEAALTTNQDPVKHMYGTLVNTDLYPNTDVNMYYFSSNHIWAVKDFTGVEKITVPAYFCYVDYEAVLADAPASAPAAGRRRVTMGVNGKDAAQGFENILGGETPMKVMIDGTLYIIRGEKVFDATGRLVK